PTDIYPLSLHDALPILSRLQQAIGRAGTATRRIHRRRDAPAAIAVVPLRLAAVAYCVHESRYAVTGAWCRTGTGVGGARGHRGQDRKSTRLNSSHVAIS